ncbi:response regulator transcription factor [Spirosoma linguale]|uniref:Two component transcriptional regulator, winged helix family n=1 Tax=Spirosoma linguale (strain ATCC 33905 / DSM 74 / LMG 10896 / Claus 1) TaxID=504472 RepID=D2QI83_SPILD|nr:two component transcriptional regulator, winged helix family [Spirosoma linguale DSM 74]
MKLLVVEDDQKLASFISKGFEAEAFEVTIAPDGQAGWRLFQANPYDVVILDVNLPYLNGFELCRYIRQQTNEVPVLLLTALDGLNDKAEGFGSGADDYLCKPFEFRELLWRVQALTRRHYRERQRVLQVADLVLDPDARQVIRGGKHIPLTSHEYALLEYLMRNRGQVVSRVDIAERVWEVNLATSTNVIDVYMGYLRKKVDRDFASKLLHTVVGMGYVLREE